MDKIRYKKVKILVLTLLYIGLTALKGQTIKDIDGNIYHGVTIGTQVWMAENLMTTKYRNGNPILFISDKTKWDNLMEGAYSEYDNPTDIKLMAGYIIGMQLMIGEILHQRVGT